MVAGIWKVEGRCLRQKMEVGIWKNWPDLPSPTYDLPQAAPTPHLPSAIFNLPISRGLRPLPQSAATTSERRISAGVIRRKPESSRNRRTRSTSVSARLRVCPFRPAALRPAVELLFEQDGVVLEVFFGMLNGVSKRDCSERHLGFQAPSGVQQVHVNETVLVIEAGNHGPGASNLEKQPDHKLRQPPVILPVAHVDLETLPVIVDVVLTPSSMSRSHES
jgi:hypothetical protein